MSDVYFLWQSRRYSLSLEGVSWQHIYLYTQYITNNTTNTETQTDAISKTVNDME